MTKTIAIDTDGTYKCVNNRKEMLGIAGLRELFKEYGYLPANDLIAQLIRSLEHYSNELMRIDDTTNLLADMRQMEL